MLPRLDSTQGSVILKEKMAAATSTLTFAPLYRRLRMWKKISLNWNTSAAVGDQHFRWKKQVANCKLIFTCNCNGWMSVPLMNSSTATANKRGDQCSVQLCRGHSFLSSPLDNPSQIIKFLSSVGRWRRNSCRRLTVWRTWQKLIQRLSLKVQDS